jgi:peroxiredoxin
MKNSSAIKTTNLFITITTCLSLFFAVQTTETMAQKTAGNRGFIVKPGDTAPQFVMHLDTGDTIDISDLKGKIVVLQFTASWCSVCRKEMPHLEKEVWQVFKDKDFLLIGIDRDEPLNVVKNFKKQMRVTYPFSLDPGANIFGLFADKKSGVTRNVVIDKKGKIVFLTRLYDKKEFNAMVDKIKELLAD